MPHLFRRLLYIFILALITMLLTPSGLNPAAASLHLQSTDPYDLLDSINALRAANGLPLYRANPILMAIAQEHAEYQASIGTWTHSGADGSRPYQRAIAAGYPLAGDLSLGGWFSENVAAGDLSIAEVIQLWQSDPPHLNTMLSSIYTDAGAGIAIANGTTYFTLDAALSLFDQSPAWLTSSPVRSIASPVPPTMTILPSTAQDNGSIVHIVHAGETLWSIAQAYGVTEEELVRLNGISSDFIFPGQELLVRSANTPTSTLPTETPTRRPTSTEWPTSTRLTDPTAHPTSASQQRASALTFSTGLIILMIILTAALSSAAIITRVSHKSERD